MVKLEDIDFSKDFSVFSTNQIEARTILTPTFMERMKKLKEIFKSNHVDVAFFENIALFAIHTEKICLKFFQFQKKG